MVLLLDTNAFIWTLANVDKLGKRAFADISSSVNKVCVSNVSLLECAIKIRTGKLKFDLDFSAVDEFLEQANIQQISFDAWAASQYIELPNLPWTDPFDAAIISQAITKHMILVTSDQNILEINISGLRTLDAQK
jgi:PIN domain nuclease of toxin-antitoxin system